MTDDFFSNFARLVERAVGRAVTFWLMVGVILVWAATGPIFAFSDTWQLIINTATTIITFLMVFLIQNTQTRDTRAMQLKLDELIRAQDNASNALRGIERIKTEAELDQMSEQRADPNLALATLGAIEHILKTAYERFQE